jgi:pimeloyl-ACP methyl ester carboxylesterase
VFEYLCAKQNKNMLLLRSGVACLLLSTSSMGLRQGSAHGLRRRSLHMKAVFKSSVVQEKKLPILDVDSNFREVTYIDIGQNKNPLLPPLMVLCGTAQTVNTYTQHLRTLTASRRVIIPELRCQGTTELLSKFGSMEQHCNDVTSIMKSLGLNKVDLIGFSFGGRVALSLAAHKPHLVRKLSVTGVPLVRSSLGRFVLESWRQSLENNNIRDCAWSFILNGYSEEFIDKNQKALQTYVDIIVQSNPQPSRILDLITYSHVSDDCPLYSIPACVDRVQCPTQVIAGTSDRIAGFQNTKDLSAAIRNSIFTEMSAGHLVPFERPIDWRQNVLSFMNE